MTPDDALKSFRMGRPPRGFVRSLFPEHPARSFLQHVRMYGVAAVCGMLIGAAALFGAGLSDGSPTEKTPVGPQVTPNSAHYSVNPHGAALMSQGSPVSQKNDASRDLFASWMGDPESEASGVVDAQRVPMSIVGTAKVITHIVMAPSLQSDFGWLSPASVTFAPQATTAPPSTRLQH